MYGTAKRLLRVAFFLHVWIFVGHRFLPLSGFGDSFSHASMKNFWHGPFRNPIHFFRPRTMLPDFFVWVPPVAPTVRPRSHQTASPETSHSAWNRVWSNFGKSFVFRFFSSDSRRCVDFRDSRFEMDCVPHQGLLGEPKRKNQATSYGGEKNVWRIACDGPVTRPPYIEM
jgi:hypothetical protein